MRVNGLAARLIAFFEANPLEELEVKDIAVKFDISEGRVRNVLAAMVASGFVENVRVVRLRAKGQMAPVSQTCVLRVMQLRNK